MVRDDWQNRGIGSFILKHVVTIAKRNGIAGFTAEVMRDNKSMQAVINHSGLKVNSKLADGVYHFEMDFLPSGMGVLCALEIDRWLRSLAGVLGVYERTPVTQHRHTAPDVLEVAQVDISEDGPHSFAALGDDHAPGVHHHAVPVAGSFGGGRRAPLATADNVATVLYGPGFE